MSFPSGARLDVRVPIGALFTLLGLLLVGYGLATAGDAQRYARSDAIDVNLWWGLAVLAFGLVLLLAAARAARAKRTAAVRRETEIAEPPAVET